MTKKLSERLRCAIEDFPIIVEHPAVLLEEAAAVKRIVDAAMKE